MQDYFSFVHAKTFGDCLTGRTANSVKDIVAPDAGVSLINAHIPRYTFAHRYEIVVNSGDAAAVFDIARDVDLAASPIVQALFRLRGLPRGPMNAQAFIRRMGWSSLGERRPHEFVIGYWRSHRVERVQDLSTFAGELPGATQKVAFSFRFLPAGSGRVRVVTETRVLCIGRRVALAFWPYWIAIKPFSGRIRQEVLRLIKLEAERRAANPRPAAR